MLTPRSDLTRLSSDIKVFSRKLRLREYFSEVDEASDANRLPSEENKNLSLPTKFKSRSQFTPRPGRKKGLDPYVDALNMTANNLYCHSNFKSNIKQKEGDAIKELKQT